MTTTETKHVPNSADEEPEPITNPFLILFHL